MVKDQRFGKSVAAIDVRAAQRLNFVTKMTSDDASSKEILCYGFNQVRFRAEFFGVCLVFCGNINLQRGEG